MRKTVYPVLMALALVWAGCKPAEETTSTSASTTESASATDTVSTDTGATGTVATTTAAPPTEFVTTAGEVSLFEIAAGKLALEKSTNADVRGYGELMIRDHTKLYDELKPLGFPVPPNMGPSNQQMLDALAKLSGAQFDAAYANDMVNGHEAAVGLFQGEAAEGTNEGVKAFAVKWLPVIEEHLKLAKELQGKVH